MLSLGKGDVAVSESEMKVTLNGTNVFEMPLLGFSKFALPGVIGELAEQGAARAREGYEKIKVASEEMTEALRDQQMHSLKPIDAWVLEFLETGVLPAGEGVDRPEADEDDDRRDAGTAQAARGHRRGEP